VLSLLDEQPLLDEVQRVNETSPRNEQSLGPTAHLEYPMPILRNVLSTIRTGPDAIDGGATQPLSISTVATALLAHLSATARHKPLLVVIDDVQWADPSSAATLSFVARRLLADRIVLVFGLRTSAASLLNGTSTTRRTDNEDSLHRGPSFDRRGLIEVDLQPMDENESVEVLKSLGCGTIESMRVAPRAAGLPLALTELAAVLRDKDDMRTDLCLSLPDHFRDVIGNLSADLKNTLHVCALNDEFRVVLGVVGPSARTHLETAESLEILSVNADRIVFRHPLLRAAVLNIHDSRSEREQHRQIVKALDPKIDADAIAQHLAAGADGINDNAATLLAEFAIRAQKRGAHAEAAAAFLRASTLSSDHTTQAQHLLSSGRTLYYGGDAQNSNRHRRNGINAYE
jgi:hypothetical protein